MRALLARNFATLNVKQFGGDVHAGLLGNVEGLLRMNRRLHCTRACVRSEYTRARVTVRRMTHSPFLRGMYALLGEGAFFAIAFFSWRILSCIVD